MILVPKIRNKVACMDQTHQTLCSVSNRGETAVEQSQRFWNGAGVVFRKRYRAKQIEQMRLRTKMINIKELLEKLAKRCAEVEATRKIKKKVGNRGSMSI